MIMRLSTKGQVTIPQEIRELAGIRPGSAVDIEFQDGSVRLRRVPDDTPAGQKAVAALRAARGKFTMSTEDIMAMTRDWGEDEA